MILNLTPQNVRIISPINYFLHIQLVKLSCTQRKRLLISHTFSFQKYSISSKMLYRSLIRNTWFCYTQRRQRRAKRHVIRCPVVALRWINKPVSWWVLCFLPSWHLCSSIYNTAFKCLLFYLMLYYITLIILLL